MSIIAKTVDNESKYPEVSTGVHKARCVKVIDLGTQENNYDGQVTWKRQCMVIWEVPSEVNNNGEPLTISKFWSVMSEEDREYVQMAQNACEDKQVWVRV